MWFRSYIPALFILLFILNLGHCAHILFFHMLTSYSHQIATYPLAQALAAKGHHVTYLTGWQHRGPLQLNSSIEFLIPSKLETLIDSLAKSDFDINFRIEKKFPRMVHQFFPLGVLACEQMLTSPDLQEWMDRTPKLDLMILDNWFPECGMAIAYKYSAKSVIFNTVIHVGSAYDTYGFNPETSSIPEMEINSFRAPMSFWERVVNTLIPIHYRWAHYSHIKEIDGVVRKFVKDPDMPFVDDLARNVSLILYTGDVVTDMPRSIPPLMVNVGGIHCYLKEKVDKLPEKLAQFVEDPSSDGFIYVSFGSLVQPSNLPPTLKKIFFDTFASFPKLKFLWKWEGPQPEVIPKNVMLVKWVPQVDILAHKKIKGFITQGGRPSMNEAVCNAVPMIIFPVLADQDWNANRIEEQGGSIRMEFETLNRKELTRGIQKLAYETSLKKRMVELNEILLDQPITALNKAVWWVEYVLRRKDTSHLKPAGFHQWWYERRLLDVWVFLFLLTTKAISLIMGIIILLVKKVMWGKRDNSKRKNKRD